MSIRKVHSNGRTIVGFLSSHKSDEVLQFESLNEQRFLFVLHFDSKVKKIEDQPVRIEYSLRSKQKSYVPDFFVEYFDGRRAFFEIKTEEGKKAQGKKFAAAYRAAKAYASKCNSKFHLLTDAVLDSVYTKNVKYLLMFKTDTIDLAVQHRILTELRKRTVATGNELLKVIAQDKDEYIALIRPFWVLVYKKIITCDLVNVNLTMNSPFWECSEKHPPVELSYPYTKSPKIVLPRLLKQSEL